MVMHYIAIKYYFPEDAKDGTFLPIAPSIYLPLW